jgi:hypothetical protein
MNKRKSGYCVQTSRTHKSLARMKQQREGERKEEGRKQVLTNENENGI